MTPRPTNAALAPSTPADDELEAIRSKHAVVGGAVLVGIAAPILAIASVGLAITGGRCFNGCEDRNLMMGFSVGSGIAFNGGIALIVYGVMPADVTPSSRPEPRTPSPIPDRYPQGIGARGVGLRFRF